VIIEAANNALGREERRKEKCYIDACKAGIEERATAEVIYTDGLQLP
jgi:hypothetical protein